MTPNQKPTEAHRQGGCRCPKVAGQMRVSDAGFDAFELATLEIMRHYFTTFGSPATQSWIRAHELCFMHFSQSSAPMQAVRILAAVQMMRRSRRSVFCFSSPTCPVCVDILTDAERHLMASVQSIRIGRVREAQTHAMLLCEGNDTTEFLAAIRVMCSEAPEIAAPAGA